MKWHQDFPFQPMTNDDMITCLLFIDDVTPENGPLEVIPEVKGPLYPHWHDGVFTGAVNDDIIETQRGRITHCTGRAGSVCLMHEPASRLGAQPDRPATHALHHNLLRRGRHRAEPNHLPSRFTHELVRGEVTGTVRCSSIPWPCRPFPRAHPSSRSRKAPTSDGCFASAAGRRGD